MSQFKISLLVVLWLCSTAQGQLPLCQPMLTDPCTYGQCPISIGTTLIPYGLSSPSAQIDIQFPNGSAFYPQPQAPPFYSGVPTTMAPIIQNGPAPYSVPNFLETQRSAQTQQVWVIPSPPRSTTPDTRRPLLRGLLQRRVGEPRSDNGRT
jgi:hypothetical protein